MNELLSGAPLIDLVIAVSVVEVLILAVYHRVTGSGVAPREFALNMASGLCLMGALRCVCAGAGAAWMAAFLLVAGVCHAADIARRWQRRPSGKLGDRPLFNDGRPA